MPAGNNTNVVLHVSGPCYGNNLNVTFTNLDPAVAGTLTWVINSTSHVHLRSVAFQPVFAAVNGFTLPAGQPYSGLICATSPTIAANGTAARLMGVWGGRAKVNVDLNGSAAGVNVDIEDPGTLYSTFSKMPQYRKIVAAGAQSYDEIWLPNGPMVINIKNTSGTSAVTPVVTVTRCDL